VFLRVANRDIAVFPSMIRHGVGRSAGGTGNVKSKVWDVGQVTPGLATLTVGIGQIGLSKIHLVIAVPTGVLCSRCTQAESRLFVAGLATDMHKASPLRRFVHFLFVRLQRLYRLRLRYRYWQRLGLRIRLDFLIRDRFRIRFFVSWYLYLRSLSGYDPFLHLHIPATTAGPPERAGSRITLKGTFPIPDYLATAPGAHSVQFHKFD
jgi:hypothetical protein